LRWSIKMKITKQQLKQIIKEELIKEATFGSWMDRQGLGHGSEPVGKLPKNDVKIDEGTANEMIEAGINITDVKRLVYEVGGRYITGFDQMESGTYTIFFEDSQWRASDIEYKPRGVPGADPED